MATEFKLPNLGEGVDSGEVVGVSAKVGDVIAKGGSLCEVETNKAVMDVSANFAGKITAVNVKAGDKVKPGQIIVSYEASTPPLEVPSKGSDQASKLPSSPPKVASNPGLSEAPKVAESKASAPTPGSNVAKGMSLEPHHGLSPEEAASKHVVVIGAGPGGYAAAFYASDLGYQVTLINKETRLGGVCTLRGCIPSKGLLHVAKLINEAKHSDQWGVSFGAPKIDIAKLRAYKDGFVNNLGAGIGQVASARKVRTIEGLARFKNSSSLEIIPGDGGKAPAEKEISFDYCVIATGSIPAMPGPWNIGDERVMDSTGALELKDIPKKLCVIGGGYIGLEMACVYAALGSEITVVEFLPGLLMAADRDLVRPLQARLTSQFKAIHVNTKVEKLEAVKEGIRVTMTGEGVESPQVFDRVLVSVGRRPVSQGLGLENTKVKVTDKGFIEHDTQLRTADPNIFVIGDIAGEPMLAHKAHAEARVAVEAINGQRSTYDVIAMPAVVFTDPELAWVGVTEEEAKKQGLDVEVARYPWAASGKAHAISRTEGVSKIIVDKASGRILGAGVTGYEAGNLISEYALAIEMGANAEDVSLTVHPHPTLGETILGAVDITLGHATDIYRPKEKMKSSRLIGLAALALALAGCAGLSMRPEALAALAGRQLIVSVPEVISFPQHFTLQKNNAAPQGALGSQMMEALGNSGMEQRIAKALDDTGVSLGRNCAEFFARELRGSGLFAGVNHAGGEAQFDVKVSEWGLAWDDVGGHYVPLLEMDASLSLPVLGVVWRGHRNAADLSSQAKSPIYDLDPSRLLGRPQNLSGALDAVAADLAAQLVADLKGQAQIH